MVGDEKERWIELCELATKEQDPVKLMDLVAEINRILESKEQRLKAADLKTKSTGKEPPAASESGHT
jgi:hypothetical protein